MSLLHALLQDVKNVWPYDSTRPGLVISDLGDEGIYVSICRYKGVPMTKQVVCSARAGTLEHALEALALSWLSFCGRSDAFLRAARLSRSAFLEAFEKARS